MILHGTVGAEVQRVEAAAHGAPRARRRAVDDRLHVRPLDRRPARVDADTEAAVIAALIDDGEIPATAIDVDAHGDSVILSGLVDESPQRDRAERVALAVGGVAHVHNELRVFCNVSADEVAERVTDAIGTDAIVGADRVRVERPRQRGHADRQRGLPRAPQRGGRSGGRHARRRSGPRPDDRAAGVLDARASGAAARPIGRRARRAQTPTVRRPARGIADTASAEGGARDVAHVGACQLDHLADAAVEHDLAGGEREALDLLGGDVRRDRERVGVGDEVDERRARVGERLGERRLGRPPGSSTRTAWMPTAAAIAA